MALGELSPLRGRSSGGRHRWWLDQLANVHEDLSDRPRIAARMAAAAGGLPRVRRPWKVSHSCSSLKEMRRMSPPQAGHTTGNSSAIRASSLAQAMREVSWERFCD